MYHSFSSRMGDQSSQKTKITEDMKCSFFFFGFGHRSKLRDNEIMHIYFLAFWKTRMTKRRRRRKTWSSFITFRLLFEILSEKSISLDNYQYIFFSSSALSWSPLSSSPRVHKLFERVIILFLQVAVKWCQMCNFVHGVVYELYLICIVMSCTRDANFVLGVTYAMMSRHPQCHCGFFWMIQSMSVHVSLCVCLYLTWTFVTNILSLPLGLGSFTYWCRQNWLTLP